MNATTASFYDHYTPRPAHLDTVVIGDDLKCDDRGRIAVQFFTRHGDFREHFVAPGSPSALRALALMDTDVWTPRYLHNKGKAIAMADASEVQS